MDLTKKQMSLIDKLLTDKIEPAQHANWRYHMKNAATRTDLDRGFQALFALPRLAGAVQVHAVTPDLLPNVETAHYALGSGDDFTFYRVDRPAKGAWAGRTFLKVQAGDDYFSIRETVRVAAVLEEIAKDPEQALANYGHQIGRCGICNRTLTDDKSRARGMGEVCASKL